MFYSDIRESLEWQFSHILHWNLIPTPPLNTPPLNTARVNTTNADFHKWTQKLQTCVQCPLHIGRTHVVTGQGNLKSDIFIVGPQPNVADDREGKPFQGAPGQLLTKMMQAINRQTQNLYYAPIVKCRPPKDRPPQAQEIDTCESHLLIQIAQVQPNIVLAMGELAAQTLFRTEAPLSHLRGKWGTYSQIPLLATWDTTTLLQNPTLKKEAWTDLQMLMKKLGPNT